MPTEKLLGLFLAAVVRESGLERVTRELLTSQGREIYSYVYDAHRLGSEAAPVTWPSFDQLVDAAVAIESPGPIIPIAWLSAAGGDGDLAESRPTLAINPSGEESARQPPPDTCGFMALTTSFREMRRLATRLSVGLDTGPVGDGLVVPSFERPAASGHVSRVLVCGFRPATFSLCEALMSAFRGCAVTLIVADEGTAQRARDSFMEQDTHARLGLLDEYGPQGHFVRSGDGTDRWSYVSESNDEVTGSLSMILGDWAADSVLTELPGDAQHVGDMERVYILGGAGAGADG
ncbi:MAG: hypothetical protein QF464_09810, partial [Myxococcota bacterium]|nr:hypothetical protein [Myxococcota bacterium]